MDTAATSIDFKFSKCGMLVNLIHYSKAIWNKLKAGELVIIKWPPGKP